VFDEMLAAGEVMPTAVMCNVLIGGRRGEGNGRHDPNASKTTSHHGDYPFDHLPPTVTLPDKLFRHPWDLVIIELLSSPILFATGIHLLPVLPPHPKLPQGLP
jgi:hypothetical protein